MIKQTYLRQPEYFKIIGGSKLHGEVFVDSAKNAVLPILAACVLHNGKITIHNCPKISDVENMLEILKCLGCTYTWKQSSLSKLHTTNTLLIDASYTDCFSIPQSIACEIRSSIFLLGSILSRCSRARVSYPGGCDIGLRPIDLHLKGLRELGVEIKEEDGLIICDGRYMHSGNIHLDFPSVGATENLMMAAAKLPGITTITNAAKEPEIIDLQNFINSLGGNVKGAGTAKIYIEGVESFHDTQYTPIPDRIIAGTYLLAGAITGGDITVRNTIPEDLTALLVKLKESGCIIDIERENGKLPRGAPEEEHNKLRTDSKNEKQENTYSTTHNTYLTHTHTSSALHNTYSIHLIGKYRPTSCQEIQTQPHPGFATDLQAQMTAYQSICDGSCIVIENLFETRFKYVPELQKMGANISVHGKIAMIRGVKSLHGTPVTAMDLRGGAALVLAGLRADGETIVYNPACIDRGYYNIEGALRQLGANIERINET